jgi:hypothetical protein
LQPSTGLPRTTRFSSTGAGAAWTSVVKVRAPKTAVARDGSMVKEWEVKMKARSEYEKLMVKRL